MLPERLHDEIRALQGFTSSAAGPVVAQYCKRAPNIQFGARC